MPGRAEAAAPPGGVAVVIPAYQAAATIAGVVQRARRAAPGAVVYVVDDGSTDATGDEGRRSGAQVLVHGQNQQNSPPPPTRPHPPLAPRGCGRDDPAERARVRLRDRVPGGSAGGRRARPVGAGRDDLRGPAQPLSALGGYLAAGRRLHAI